jgi:ABC-type transport system involved in multi-copper enzyme maturation permease subunit
MSAIASPYVDTLDVSETRPVSMSTLVKVEMRKMVDTRAGKWLLIIIGVITVLAVVIFGLAAHDSDKTYGNFMGFTGTPQGFLLPVLGILLVTQEWGQRTGMVTFTLVPHRGKVLWSKVAAALLFGFAAVVLAMAAGALATLVFGGTAGFDGFSALTFLKFAVLQASGVVQGLAFGLLFLNSAAAIVTFFVLPTAFSILANVWSFLSDRAAWIDLGTAQSPLYDDGNLSGKEWSQLGVTLIIWVVIPFAVGMWRVLRAEVK